MDPETTAESVELSTRYLIGQGILGIVVLVLGVAVVFLWRRYEASIEARITDKDEIKDANEKLAKEMTSALVANTSALEQFTDGQREVRDAVKSLTETIRLEGARGRPGSPR